MLEYGGVGIPILHHSITRFGFQLSSRSWQITTVGSGCPRLRDCTIVRITVQELHLKIVHDVRCGRCRVGRSILNPYG